MTGRRGRKVLITGGTSGIGAAAARLFAERGDLVYAVSRKAKPGGEQVGEGEILTLPMDVCDEESVQKAFEVIGGVDVLIHSAGFGIGGSAEDTFDGEARRQFDVNFFGVLRVNRIFLPAMRQQGGGKVLFVSSVAGRIPVPFQSHYSATKAAMESYALALAVEGRPHGITVSVVEPGDTATNFTSGRSIAIPEDSPYREACLRSIAKMEQDEQTGYPPEKVARLLLKMANRRRPPARVAVGWQYRLFLLLQRLLPDRVLLFALDIMYGGKTKKT